VTWQQHNGWTRDICMLTFIIHHKKEISQQTEKHDRTEHWADYSLHMGYVDKADCYYTN
jgi:hypothetical protein